MTRPRSERKGEAMRSDAEISPCGKYRYSLSRTWDVGAQPLVFVMLNPSTADAQIDDPTIRRCVGFARRDKFGGIRIYNLFAYRASDPSKLKDVSDPFGPENMRRLDDLTERAKAQNITVVCGWGANVTDDQAWPFLNLARCSELPLYCLGRTKSGMPRHPLYVRGDQQLQEYPVSWRKRHKRSELGLPTFFRESPS